MDGARGDRDAEVEVYEAAELPDRWKLQVLSFLRIDATEGFVGPNLLRDWITGQPETTKHVVIVERDILISHTEVKWRWLEHAGDTYKVYGLSGVLTYPAFRGRGFGTLGDTRGTALIRASDADIGMLGCDRGLERFYLGAGWEPMPDSEVLFDGGDHGPYRDDELLMMLFLSERGIRGRAKFVEVPIYWGKDDPW